MAGAAPSSLPWSRRVKVVCTGTGPMDTKVIDLETGAVLPAVSVNFSASVDGTPRLEVELIGGLADLELPAVLRARCPRCARDLQPLPPGWGVYHFGDGRTEVFHCHGKTHRSEPHGDGFRVACECGATMHTAPRA